MHILILSVYTMVISKLGSFLRAPRVFVCACVCSLPVKYLLSKAGGGLSAKTEAVKRQKQFRIF